MGLGLTICKQLAERLGGNISIESKVESGTTFEFSILNYSDNQSDTLKTEDQINETVEDKSLPAFTLYHLKYDNEEKDLSSSQILLQKCNCSSILIVDDNEYNLFSLTKILSLLNKTCNQVLHIQ